MNEIIAGGLAGFAQTIIGHPLDTIKVLYINGKKIEMRNLYRGSLSPMASSVFVNAQTFYLYNYLRKKEWNIFNSGFITGIGISFIECPSELIKIRMQIGKSGYSQVGKFGYYQAISEIGWKHLYHGMTATCARNSIALGLYFTTYEFCMKNLSLGTSYNSLIGGALAGVICWTIPYPIDCIKTRIQSDITYKAKINLKNLYRGFLPCIARSFIVNPFIFLTYETVKKYI